MESILAEAEVSAGVGEGIRGWGGLGRGGDRDH